MYIDRDIDIYWYYNHKSYNSDDNGDGVDDDGNNGDRKVAVSWKSEIWKQIVTDLSSDSVIVIVVIVTFVAIIIPLYIDTL